MAKEKFLCMRCKYKFLHDRDSERILRCPFCGKEDKVIEDKPMPAEDLVSSSDDSEKFYGNF